MQSTERTPEVELLDPLVIFALPSGKINDKSINDIK